MRNLMAVVLVGVWSTVAFADVNPGLERREKVDYECKFEGQATCARCEEKKVECWVEGTLCNELDIATGERDKCKEGEDPIRIKCSDGFAIDRRDSAVSIDDGSLWINVQDYKEIATILVEDFERRGGKDGDNKPKEADLLYSKKKGEANRLEGYCKFEKRDH